MGDCMFPVTLNLSGRAVLVVGGGPVGRRKAAACAAAGGVVTVVDPAEPVAGPWAWVREAFRAEHLDGAWLAFACVSAEVNARVVADATGRRVWVLDASAGERGGFTLPAVGRAGRIMLAVATGVPGLSKALRDRLLSQLTAADAAEADRRAGERATSLGERPV